MYYTVIHCKQHLILCLIVFRAVCYEEVNTVQALSVCEAEVVSQLSTEMVSSRHTTTATEVCVRGRCLQPDIFPT